MIEDGSINLLENTKKKAIESEKYILHFDGIEEYMNVILV